MSYELLSDYPIVRKVIVFKIIFHELQYFLLEYSGKRDKSVCCGNSKAIIAGKQIDDIMEMSRGDNGLIDLH
jgi:hypothetical protein